MARGSGGRSSGRVFIGRTGSSSSSSISGEGDEAHEGLSYHEKAMRLPLEERCQIISEAYAQSIRESDVILALMRKKMMVGCPEKYFDVDSIAKRSLNTTYLEKERLDNEKRLMRWPLELRCSLVSDAYAQGIRESEPHLAAMSKKLSVGCPEKLFDIAMSSIADKS